MKKYEKPEVTTESIVTLKDVILSSGGIELIDSVFGWEGENERW